MTTRALLSLCSFVLLAGCTSSGQDELQAWMQTERNAIRPSVQPIAEPTRFVPQPYDAERLVPPFSTEKLASLLRGMQSASASSSALIEPELARRRQPLEAFPLDAMTMVGSLDRGGQLVALVRIDRLLYQVRPGNYLGQNFGRVTRITESEVVLREVVQDAAGEWIERQAALQLVEDAK